MAVQSGESVRMRVLAERMRYDQSNLTGVVDRLEVRGIVTRHADPEDRRAKALRLTPAGVALKRALWDLASTDDGPLAAKELVGLRDLLRATFPDVSLASWPTELG